jgi:hypothetical protein
VGEFSTGTMGIFAPALTPSEEDQENNAPMSDEIL